MFKYTPESELLGKKLNLIDLIMLNIYLTV